MLSLETAGRIIGSLHNSAFACPHCGESYDGSECGTAQFVVSYWGDEDHDFSCQQCGKDFVVRENVMRCFEVGLSSEEIDER